MRPIVLKWTARVDFIHERKSDRLAFLEYDVASLIGPGSALAASLAAAGISREEQLSRLLGERQRRGCMHLEY